MRLFAFLFALAACIGCESDNKSESPDMIIQTPFAHDPTHEFDVMGWWWNGHDLLHLRADNSFIVYEHTNRYESEVQNGKWRQESYAALWLEVYAIRPPDPIHVEIGRLYDVLTLRIDNGPPMLAVVRPPDVLEDRLVGMWEGASGTLILGGDARYVFSLSASTVPSSGGVASHRGRWHVDEKTLTLLPNSPAIAPAPLKIDQQEDGILLSDDDGTLRRSVTARSEAPR